MKKTDALADGTTPLVINPAEVSAEDYYIYRSVASLKAPELFTNMLPSAALQAEKCTVTLKKAEIIQAMNSVGFVGLFFLWLMIMNKNSCWESCWFQRNS